MYTYGSPRVGNTYFAFAVSAAIPNIYRVVHYQDLVPHVPPCGLASLNPLASCTLSETLGDPKSLLYHPWHTGTQVFYTDEDATNYKICTGNSGEDPTCSDKFIILNWNDHLNYKLTSVNLPFPPTCSN